MACYHFTVKTDKSPDGLSIKSVTHSDYINREGKYKNYDYTQELKRQTYGKNAIGGVENAPVLLHPKAILKRIFGSIKDFGDRFAVTDAPGSQTVDAALLLAVKRYGTRLSITGDPKFKAQVIAAALAMKVKIECPTDPDLQKSSPEKKRRCTKVSQLSPKEPAELETSLTEWIDSSSVSPTLKRTPRRLQPRAEVICKTCPLALWFRSKVQMKCYCGAMHVVSWDSLNPQAIIDCDGPEKMRSQITEAESASTDSDE